MSHRTRRVDPRYSRRLEKVRGWLSGWEVDALLITHPPNLRYLTGFDGSMGALLLSAERCSLIVDGRYVTAARARVEHYIELRDVRVQLAPHSLEQAIIEVATQESTLRRIGIEGAVMTVSCFSALSSGLAASDAFGDTPTLIPLERAVEGARLIKDDSELNTLREAGDMLSGVARQVLALARPGLAERDVAAEIDCALRRAGFDRPAFDTIVASGPNSALPHARPGSRCLAPGDGVVLDFGGVYDGYCVDLTRTVQLEPETAEFRQLFEAVRSAHRAALAAVRPGVTAGDVDRAARDLLSSRGLGDAFMHATGHGLGLEVHEEPRIRKPSTAHADEVLQPGMVFTIEPGVYVADLGGVRIEDDVLVTEQGYELLTDVPIERAV